MKNQLGKKPAKNKCIFNSKKLIIPKSIKKKNLFNSQNKAKVVLPLKKKKSIIKRNSNLFREYHPNLNIILNNLNQFK
jgi:hypothetical protein